MNRQLLRPALALLALTAAGVVLAVAVVGLVGLAAGLILTEPMSQGRLVSATLAIVGGALLLVVYAVDPYALRRAAGRARAVVSRLLETVTTAGRP